MKLFKKLFLQIFLAFLVLSQAVFFYLLYESRRQAVESIQHYEKLSFQGKTGELDQKLRGMYETEEQEIQDRIVASAFRQYVGSQGILYRGTKELFNISAYEYEVEDVFKRTGDRENGLLLKNGDRRLLLFWNMLTFGKNYRVLYYKDITEIYQRFDKLFLEGLLFTVGALLFIGVFLFHGIYRTIRPLVELKKTAALLADGNYGIRLPVRGKDEIAELTESFNQMAEKIEEHVEKLSPVNETQRQLLGSLAHELKTPMTAIIGYADTLLTLRLSERRREEALQYIGDECRRLSRLSVKMLELTGLYEMGESTIERKEVEVLPFLEKVKELTFWRLQEKKLSLEISCTPEDLTKTMDQDLMMSLVMNLVDNAVKASKEGGKIWIRADERELSVKDEGKGIPMEDLARVTEAFYMVDKARARSAGSVGLGLAICEEIAMLHGARLSLESEEGKGTCVHLFY